MGIIAILALLMLMHHERAKGPTPSGPITPPLFPAAPSGPVTPAGFPVPSPAQAVKIATTPPAWPQGRPADLPPWPSGWTPAQPPPAAVVTRAWQLLPVLWAKGLGATQAENTAGQWIMYVASWMNPQKTMKGVVAFKPKAGAVHAITTTHSSANA